MYSLCGLGGDRICPLPESVEWFNPIELGTHPQWDGERRMHLLSEGARWYDPMRTHYLIHYTHRCYIAYKVLQCRKTQLTNYTILPHISIK